jgi:hypothetical protein
MPDGGHNVGPGSHDYHRPLWKLRCFGRTVQVIRARDRSESEKLQPYASDLLETAFGDPISRSALLEMDNDTGGNIATAGRGLSESNLRKRLVGSLENAFRRGYFVILAPPQMDFHKVESAPPEAKSTAAPPPGKPQKTWIEIKLVDLDGDPVPDQKYKIDFPDGSSRQNILNSAGDARFTGIEPGTCTVWFPDIDAREWDRI